MTRLHHAKSTELRQEIKCQDFHGFPNVVCRPFNTLLTKPLNMGWKSVDFDIEAGYSYYIISKGCVWGSLTAAITLWQRSCRC